MHHNAPDAALGRGLMREIGEASLATLDADGGPFASYVITAPGFDGTPLLLLSELATHTRNIARDPRASLLFVRAAETRATTAARLTLTGNIRRETYPEAKRLFLARHPEAALYAGFSDFAFWRFDTASAHLVAGFGRIVDLTPGDLLGPSGCGK